MATRTPHAKPAPSLSAPTQRENLTVYELDDEALVFDPVSSDTHRLNATALFVWRLCDGRHALDRISQALTRTYEVDPDAAREHAERILQEFLSHGLISVQEHAA